MFPTTLSVCSGYVPPLDADFLPAALYNRAFRHAVQESGGGIPLVIGLERAHGALSRYKTAIFPEEHPASKDNLRYVERIIKFLLWQRSGWKVYVGGPEHIAAAIKAVYTIEGERSFDVRFMGEDVYLQPFTVIPCKPDEVPPQNEPQQPLGFHLDGYRIGFDLGASDLKVSAIANGDAIFATEIEWNPRDQRSPDYHRQKIVAALKLAASKMPRVDAIGGSSAGVYIDNRPMIASLFRGVPKEDFDQVRSMFLQIREEFGVPLEIVNDGEVTALAGSMSLGDNGVLGIAMGSSEAAGYVTVDGNITSWLNELAFAPVDYNPDAPIDEWSGDRGVGAQYFSQQCVFRLARKAGVQIPAELSNAQKLRFVQEKLEAGDADAVEIWQSMGIYLGYALAHYADFYDLKHVLILGRCTSGRGGPLMVEGARKVLQEEFPALAAKLTLHLPDEKSRRVGQSIAAASLPMLRGG
ncbi:MAG: ROK family protein [Anaerolineae bacterium]|nr:ROK family protein [Anaerolineae bacterium]